MRELFIYYRVASAQVDDARVAVLEFQASLRALHPGLDTRLYRRDGPDDGQTWMETYARPAAPDGVDADIESSIVRLASGLAEFIPGPRHVETFLPCV